MQVHVQRPEHYKGLKALAVLLWLYEEEIARLHPPCRHPTHENAVNQFESNRLPLCIPRIALNVEPKSTGWTPPATASADLSLFGMRQATDLTQVFPLFSNDPAREWQSVVEIFNWPAAHPNDADCDTNGDTQWLEKQAGCRNRQANFVRASWLEYEDTSATYKAQFAGANPARPLPETVEFRQARGTLEAEDVDAWVEFCVGLVQLADDLATQKKRFPYLLNDRTLKDAPINILDLFELIDMDMDRVNYWSNRMAKWMIYRPNDEDDRTDATGSTSLLHREHPNQYTGPERPMAPPGPGPAGDGQPPGGPHDGGKRKRPRGSDDEDDNDQDSNRPRLIAVPGAPSKTEATKTTNIFQ